MSAVSNLAADKALQNARDDTPAGAHGSRTSVGQGDAYTQVYKQFIENEWFKRFVGDMVYEPGRRTSLPSPP